MVGDLGDFLFPKVFFFFGFKCPQKFQTLAENRQLEIALTLMLRHIPPIKDQDF